MAGMKEAGGVFGQGGEGVRSPLRAGLYARVSTHDQQTLPMQVAEMRRYAALRGWTVAREIEDVGSGASEREAREQLILACKRREIDFVLVWKLDRWGRSLADLVASLHELHALGVGFVSVTEALDFTTPSGRAMAGMLAVFAEFERDLLRDRVKAGIAEARKRGTPIGRPATARTHADRVHELLASGMSRSRIARELGIGRTSVRRLLADPEVAPPVG